MPDRDYGKVAGKLHGAFDYLILRETDIRPALPAIFHSHGLRVLAYMYLGAWRRDSPQVTPEVESDHALRSSTGALFTAPRSPGGPWILCDIRRRDVRARFVEFARRAVEVGFDGIFLDGYPFWADDVNHRGGAAPAATQSLAGARWQLLAEMRRAVHETSSTAVVGALGNQFYDALGLADFVLKERMHFMWDRFAPQFDQRATRVRQGLDVDFERFEAPYVPCALAYGAKGCNPLSVQTALGFVRHPGPLTYIGLGDFYPHRLDDWLDRLLAVADPTAPRIVRIEPDHAWLHFSGLDELRVDIPCRVAFSAPVSISVGDAPALLPQGHTVLLEPDETYRIRSEHAGVIPRATK